MYIITHSPRERIIKIGLLLVRCSFSDALSCNVQIVNKMGLKFQQNQLKGDTNIVLYQNLVDDTILQI